MALLGSGQPREVDVGCKVVQTYRLLGCLIDDQLLFTPMLREAVGRAKSQFSEILHAAESSGFSLPVVAAQLPVRIEPGLTFIAPLLVLEPRMSRFIDKLQADNAKSLLNCDGLTMDCSILAVQCGWEQVMSTKIIEEAIMALAKLQVLPATHPAARMLEVASQMSARTWRTSVLGLMADAQLPWHIPAIVDPQVCMAQELEEARQDRFARKKVLVNYRRTWVRPALVDACRARYEKAASALSLYAGLSFLDLQPFEAALSFDLLDIDLGSKTWSFFRMWAVARLTGCWPLRSVHGFTTAATLPSCPLCGELFIALTHCLCLCPGTERFNLKLGGAAEYSRNDKGSTLKAVFGPAHDKEMRARQIEYVCACIMAITERDVVPPSSKVDDGIDLADI